MCLADILFDPALLRNDLTTLSSKAAIMIEPDTTTVPGSQKRRKLSTSSAGPNKRSRSGPSDLEIIEISSQSKASDTEATTSARPRSELRVAHQDSTIVPRQAQDALDRRSIFEAEILKCNSQNEALRRALNREKFRVVELEQTATTAIKLTTSSKDVRAFYESTMQDMMKQEKMRMEVVLEKRTAAVEKVVQAKQEKLQRQIHQKNIKSRQLMAEKDVAAKQKLSEQSNNHKNRMDEKARDHKRKIEQTKQDAAIKINKSRAEHASHKQRCDEQVQQLKEELRATKDSCRQKIEQEKEFCKKQIQEAQAIAKAASLDFESRSRETKDEYKEALAKQKEEMRDEVKRYKPEYSADIRAKQKVIEEVEWGAKLLEAKLESERSQNESRRAKIAAKEREIDQQRECIEKIMVRFQDKEAENRQLVDYYNRQRQKALCEHAKEKESMLEKIAMWKDKAERYSSLVRRTGLSFVDVRRAHTVLQGAHQHNLDRIEALETQLAQLGKTLTVSEAPVRDGDAGCTKQSG